MTYEDFFPAEEIEIYKKVKRGTMRLGMTARRVAARLAKGEIQEYGHEYVLTDHGEFCMIMAKNSLNSTERWAIENEGAEIVVMTNDDEMGAWLDRHGVRGGVKRFQDGVRSAL